MRMAARAENGCRAAELYTNYEYRAKLSVQSARVAASAARLMEAYQRGLLTLARIRGGGRQTVTVIHQHVNVEPGGAAAVAGAISSST
jgi:hypothetical protein